MTDSKFFDIINNHLLNFKIIKISHETYVNLINSNIFNNYNFSPCIQKNDIILGKIGYYYNLLVIINNKISYGEIIFCNE